ncbi:MAG: alpha/beta fold hydrolase [Vitreimonas sp.]
MRRREFVGGIAAGTVSACAQQGSDSIDAATFHGLRQFVELSFGRVAFVERGEGPAALFLHGFPLSGFQWRDALVRLAPYRCCIAPDFLGLGFSEPAAGQSLAPAAQTEMLAALLDALGIESVDLVANDSGIAVAQLFAVKYPVRVRTMLLTNGDVEFDCPPAALLPVIELGKAGRWVDEWIAPWVNDPDLARSAEGIGGMCYSRTAFPTDDGIECYLAPLASSAARKALANGYAAALEHNALAGIEAQLRGCAAPTRIIWGEADPIFSARSPGYLDGLLPQSRGVRRLAQAKLFFPEEYPDIIAEEARRLWGVT